MPDWTRSMIQTFEYYTVDPYSWSDIRKIDEVISCSILRDENKDTLGSANFEIDLFTGECYIRPYLITIQNGIKERFPLGTFLVQTPSYSYDSKTFRGNISAYTPLIELKEKYLPIGYTARKGTNIMMLGSSLSAENMRPPVIKSTADKKLNYDFTAENTDTILSYTKELIANAGYHFYLDDLGQTLFAPDQETASLRPVMEFDDGNSSILYPEINIDHDLYGVPNVVEVLYSTSSGSFYAKATNNNRNSPTSIYSRGREIMSRITDPKFTGVATQNIINEYAAATLKAASVVTGTVTYTHGYYPVHLGDCVLLRYKALEEISPLFYPIKARIVSQSITCKTGCPIEETAEFTINLMEGMS